MKRFLCVLALTLTTSNAAMASGPKDPLEGFYGELTKVAASKKDRDHVRIAWYGDSAIISDGYTGAVRERLQARFGDAGPGFVLAAPTFEGYLRQGVRLKRQGWDSNSILSGTLSSGLYGFGGVVATGMSGASATFQAKAPIKAFEIFYEKSAKGGRIEIIHGSAKAAAATVDTSGSGSDVYRYVPEGETSELKTLKIRAMGGAVRVYGVVLESADRGVQLDAIGILGIRARRWLNADAAHIKGQVAQRKPDLIVMNFGGNERVDPGLKKAAHVADLEKTLEVLKAGAPAAACLVVGPIAHGVEDGGKVVLDPALATIYEAQREFAAAAGCGFFDTLEAMGGKKAFKSWRDKKLLSGDYAHLTTKGHQELGKLIADWLEAGYDNAKKGR